MPLKKRTRTRGGTHVVNCYLKSNYKYYNRPWVLGKWRKPRTLSTGVGEIITDEITTYVNGKPTISLEQSRKIFKEVSHQKILSSMDDADFIETSSGIDYPYSGSATLYEYYFHRGWLVSVYDSTFSFPTVPSIELNDAVDIKKAFTALQPSFKDANVNGINVYTAVLELADLRKTFSKAAYKLGKNLTRTVAEKNLLVNFGILPFFGDMIAIYDIITKLSGYIDTWNSAAYGGVVFDAHEALPDIDQTFEIDQLMAPQVYYDWTHRVKCASYGVTASTKVHLYFKPRPISAKNRINVFKRALGLDKPLTGVWEAVPFSWAIDYFLNVGEIIDAFDESIETMFQYDFVSCGYSIKSTIGGLIEYNIETLDLPRWKIKSTSKPSSFLRPYLRHEFMRGRISLESMFGYMSAPVDLHLQMDAGIKQFGYLASVAILRNAK